MTRRRTRTRRAQKGLTRRLAAYAVEILVGAAVLTGAGYFFCRYVEASEQFALKSIRVEGCDTLDPNYIIAASALTTADNVLLLNTWKAARQVKDLPGVRSCEVLRHFPNEAIIRIVERERAAVLLVDNRSYAIDNDGVVLRQIADGEILPDPYITSVPELLFLKVGESLSHPPLHEALAVWQAFNQTGMASEVTVSELAARGENDIRMICDEVPYEIRWGRGNCSDQATRLDLLWTEKGGVLACNEYLDLRFGRDIACR